MRCICLHTWPGSLQGNVYAHLLSLSWHLQQRAPIFMRGTLWVLTWKVPTDFCSWSSLSWLALIAWAPVSQAVYKLQNLHGRAAASGSLLLHPVGKGPTHFISWDPCSSVHQGVSVVQHLTPLALNHGSLGLTERCHQPFTTHGAVAGFTLSLSNRATLLLKHSSLLLCCWHILKFKKYLTR